MLDCALCYCKMVLYMHLKSSAKHSVCLLAMHITCKDTPIVQLLTGLHGVLNKGNSALRDNIGLQKSLIVASNRKAALICSSNHTRSPFHPYLHCVPWTALSHSECKSWLNIFTCGSTLFPSPQERKKSHLSTQKGNWSFTLVSYGWESQNNILEMESHCFWHLAFFWISGLTLKICCFVHSLWRNVLFKVETFLLEKTQQGLSHFLGGQNFPKWAIHLWTWDHSGGEPFPKWLGCAKWL